MVSALMSAIAGFFVMGLEPSLRFLVVMGLLFVPRRVGVPPVFRAAFGVVLMMATWVGAAHLYDDAWWVDVVIHFVLPGATAAMLYFTLARVNRLPDRDDKLYKRCPSAIVIIAFAVGLATAALWEMYEWTALALFPSATINTGYDDTILDLAMGGAGSLLGGLVILWWGVRRQRLSPRPPRPTRGQVSAATPAPARLGNR